MKRKAYILFVLTLSIIRLAAQTPYDSFAPEATRPMIEREALYPKGTMPTEEQSIDTALCVAVVDLQRQTLLLIDIHDNTIIGTAPLSDDILKWLSVDPLVDKYIHLSPYMYCNGNPIRFVDPNGLYYDEGNEVKAQKIENMIQAKIQEVSQLRDSYTEGSKEYNQSNQRLEELKLSLQDISDMRNDPDYEYRFEQGAENDTKCTSVNKQNHPVVRMISSEMALTIHEGRHGGQNARREIIFYSYGTILKYGVSSEQSAYRAQLAYGGQLIVPLQLNYSNGIPYVTPFTINNINDVSINVVNSMVQRINEFIYPPQNYNPILWKLF